MALRDGLRSGDVYVPGSRRYADPSSFLLTPQQWEPRRLEFCHVAGKPASAAEALTLANDELHAALADLEAQLARGGGPGEVRLGADGELVIPPLTAEDVPAEAEALRDELGAMLPRVPIASVLVEVDARTGFTDHLVHAGGKVARPPELKRNLLYVIIAEATNMGLGAMAESCGVPYDVLAWTAEWYFRGETLEAANAAIVNYHHRLPMARAFGTGTLSSSDGQRFPVKGKSLTARHLSRYFARGQGLSTYTHVSDQHSTFDTTVIAATDPESPYVLDGILGNQTDLLIAEHAADTHGVVVTWTPLVPQALLATGFSQFPPGVGRGWWRCRCGYCSSVRRMGRSGSSCSTRAATRSRWSRGSSGSWRPGTARPTRSCRTLTTFVTCGGSSNVTV